MNASCHRALYGWPTDVAVCPGYIESDAAPGTYYPCADCNPDWKRMPMKKSSEESILQFFGYSHLPLALQIVSRPFHDLAHAIVSGDNVAESGNVTIGSALPRNPERTVALRKLLEAKDAAVRAVLYKEAP